MSIQNVTCNFRVVFWYLYLFVSNVMQLYLILYLLNLVHSTWNKKVQHQRIIAIIFCIIWYYLYCLIWHLDQFLSNLNVLTCK
jgi:hypothetical protein